MTLRETVNQLCQKRLGRLPDLESPKGYNDKIQWLKLHDQRKEHITACDKWAVRQMVPEQHLIEARLGLAPDLIPGFVKCTHDSGGTMKVESDLDSQRAHLALAPRLSQSYGVTKGEWAYQFVPPRLMTERLLELNITDYKFHCSEGEIRWVQVIHDRARAVKETILQPSGRSSGLHMDQNMRHCPDAPVYPGGDAWTELTGLARKLAAPWKYVRVDLYWSQGQAWFGELTFWPLAGCYRTKDEPVFGDLLVMGLDKREPIVA